MARRPREMPAEARARRAAVDDPALVLEAAARFLEARPRSVEELRRRLRDNGYRPDLVGGAIERMVALGYLDDAAFARAWVESRDRARPRSARVLRDELRRKGVAGADIEAALADREAATTGEAVERDEEGLVVGEERAASGASDRAAALRLLERRGGASLREEDPRRRRARSYALLARNGFDPDVCREVASEWLARADPPPEA